MTRKNQFFTSKTISTLKWWIILILIVVAYGSNVIVRYNWVKTYNLNNEMKWRDNNLLISPDSYWYAKGVQDILNGKDDVNKSPVKHGFSQVGALLCNVIGINQERLLFFLTIFVTPLLVIPLILLGVLKKMPFTGFFAALLAVNAQALLIRTSAGIFDTDMFALTLPVFIIYFFMLSMEKQKLLNSVFLLTAIAFSLWVYPESLYLILLIQITAFLYAIFSRKLSIHIFFLVQITLAMCMDVSWWIRLIIVIFSIIIYKYKPFTKHQKMVVNSLLIITFIVYVPIFLGRLDRDGFIDDIGNKTQQSQKYSNTEDEELYTDVNLTISELKRPSLRNLLHGGFGNEIYIIVAVLGCLLLMIVYRPFILFLPLLLFGFGSLFAGVRFVAYMVPALSFGFCFFLFFWLQKITNKKYIYLTVLLLSTGNFIYASIQKTKVWIKQTAIEVDEVQQLAVLDSLSTDDDYVISWWDYGYVLKYFTGMNTIADGTIQQGELNKLISNIVLGNNQLLAVNMAYALAEYHQTTDPTHTRRQPSIVEYLLNKYEYKSLINLIKDMRTKDFQTPEFTNDVYIYFPYRMLYILSTIGLFSDKPNTNEYFMYITHKYDQGRLRLRLGKNVAWDQTTNIIYFENVRYPIKFYGVIENIKNDKPEIRTNFVNPKGVLSVIFLEDKKTHIIVNDKTLVSNFFQIGILNNFKPELMEQVINDDMMKVYKVKQQK